MGIPHQLRGDGSPEYVCRGWRAGHCRTVWLGGRCPAHARTARYVLRHHHLGAAGWGAVGLCYQRISRWLSPLLASPQRGEGKGGKGGYFFSASITLATLRPSLTS